MAVTGNIHLRYLANNQNWIQKIVERFMTSTFYFSIQSLTGGKKISGRSRLTDKVINTMQNYYGMPIPQNSNDLFAMR